MPVIQVIPDRFKVEEERLLKSSSPGLASKNNHIRRPVRGIVLKDDTFATLRVVAGNGNVIPIIDAGSKRKNIENEFFELNGKRATDIYSNFFIQQVSEERAEKQQILETFGEPFIFLFGERARIVNFQGVLLNTFDFNWEAEWWHNYDQYIRGTRCVENDARIFISYDETLVTGYIISSAAVKNSEQRNFVNFQFQMFVTSYTNFSKIGNPNAVPGVVPDGELLSQELEVTSADTEPFRPTRVDTDLNTSNIGPRKISNGSLEDLTLVEGLTANIDRVSQTFNSIRNQAESIVKRLSDLSNGTVIRVPVGFAGALEFDETSPVNLKEVTGAGIVRYSTFDQNEDEYVGTSDHYGSSTRSNGVLRIDENISAQLERDQKMVSEAEKIWSENGFQVPSSDESSVSTALIKGGFGMIAIGSNTAWRNQIPESDDTDNLPIRESRTSLPIEE